MADPQQRRQGDGHVGDQEDGEARLGVIGRHGEYRDASHQDEHGGAHHASAGRGKGEQRRQRHEAEVQGRASNKYADRDGSEFDPESATAIAARNAPHGTRDAIAGIHERARPDRDGAVTVAIMTPRPGPDP